MFLEIFLVCIEILSVMSMDHSGATSANTIENMYIRGVKNAKIDGDVDFTFNVG